MCAMSGLDINWVLDMDLLSVVDLIQSVKRVRGIDLVEQAQNVRVAFGADAKDFQKYVKGLIKDEHDTASDVEALMMRFKK